MQRVARSIHLSLVALFLALALLVAAFLGYLAWGEGRAVASSLQAPLAPSAGLRAYYLTTDIHDGASALAACGDGYHAASLWEILDTSSLKYNATLGSTASDSGQGPLTNHFGRVRTGYASSTSSTPGMGNCNAWSSSSPSDYGTWAVLEEDWTLGQHMHVWQVGAYPSNNHYRVWCVED